MSRVVHIGTRVRENRLQKKMKQAELAGKAGISASYLNLIEHNRRRIGGKLLTDIADALGLDPAVLTQSAPANVLAALKGAAQASNAGDFNDEDTENFASRFPDWARLVADQADRIGALEQHVAGLSDRMAHDPFLSESLHEVLSTVAAIRSTASILSDPDSMTLNRQKRFTENLDADSQRLADASRALAQYLDDEANVEVTTFDAFDERDQVLLAHGLHFAELEYDAVQIESIMSGLFQNLSPAGVELGRTYLLQYIKDATALPLTTLENLVRRYGPDPNKIVEHTGLSFVEVFRRLASAPKEFGLPQMGLVVSDASGALSLKVPPPGFTTPRAGAACSLWPIFTSLLQPMAPSYRQIENRDRRGQSQLGSVQNVFDSFAIAVPVGQPKINEPRTYEATMLLIATGSGAAAENRLKVGPTCRICAIPDCDARREPSVLS